MLFGGSQYRVGEKGLFSLFGSKAVRATWIATVPRHLASSASKALRWVLSTDTVHSQGK